MTRIQPTALVFSLLLSGCCTSPPARPPGSRGARSLAAASTRHFKVPADQLKTYPVCRGPGAQGVFKVYNPQRKGARATFVVTAQGAFAPGHPSYNFELAARACNLRQRLKTHPAQVAEIYVLTSASHRTWGLVLTDPTRFVHGLGAKELHAPRVTRSRCGPVLEFWTRNTSTDAFHLLRVRLCPNGRAKLLEQRRKVYPER